MFLNTVKQELELDNLEIYHGRLEDFIRKMPANSSDFVFTARAFAPLIKILDYTKTKNCRLFLLKGREIESEIDTAKQKYKFEYELIPSKTGDGFIIIIKKDR